MIIAGTRRRMYDLSTLFAWFIIYSYIGWLYETIVCSVSAGRFVQRGFMYGPLCPIYGSCIVLMIVLFSDRCKSKVSLFFSCAFLASMMEYLVSYTMESIFQNRWWDYSNEFLNLNGRICLGASIIFGISGVIIIRYLHPKLLDYMEKNFSSNSIRLANRFVLAIFLFDLFVSVQMSL
ncbi:putative ABC transporter permease [Lachnospiraceae bacterium MD1]|jgi:uncharacterized membrane protein|uniref:Putative ABC transporter permease n=1 Tax=Variimorphobacter saccharofermentans TaxID=2755051 RepID=A0A839K2Q2_9FIRM|nr:putative ABC transporter permease [Variimorphobacter saccharofermentans]MBB2183658.1 putative ABC transporter permease [Variimorphobacter saccharofermentans]